MEREDNVNQEEIIEEIKRIGLHTMNPNDPGLVRPKVYYQTTMQALDAISTYIRKYQTNEQLVSEGLVALRRVMLYDPIGHREGQEVLYQVLLSDWASESTRGIYLNLGQPTLDRLIDLKMRW